MHLGPSQMKSLYHQTDRWIQAIDMIVKPLVWYSVIMLIIEVEPSFGFGGENTRFSDTKFFLWSERIVAAILTLEFVLRWRRTKQRVYIRWKSTFPFIRLTPFALIDLLAIVPFWIGFFVPISWLSYIRMARVLRLLKYYRYSRSLQLNALGFYRAFGQLKGLAFQLLIASVIFTLVVFEAEHEKQPDKFGNLFESAWFTIITVTTVGYGDRSPITVIGMTFVALTLVFIIAQMTAAIGILNAAFNQVMEEERDPNVDPLDLWAKEFEIQQQISDAAAEYTGESSEVSDQE